MKKWILIGLGVVVVLVGAFMTVEKVSPVGFGWWGTYNTSADVALKGYDPVSYFSGDGPALGTPELSYQWENATWHFATAANRHLFTQSPGDYAPQFGGFCSFAVSKGFTADISPDAWHINAGKLYVFADSDVKDMWVADIANGSLEKSAHNWTRR